MNTLQVTQTLTFNLSTSSGRGQASVKLLGSASAHFVAVCKNRQHHQKELNMITRRLMLAAVAAVFVFPGASVRAGEFGTREEAQALVERAVAFWKANGRDKAVTAFNDKQGPFVDRDLYIVAANLSDGVRIAHGANPKMIGKSLNDFKDVDGKPYGLEILELARTKGTGWVDYKFANPVTKKVMDKASYVVRVADVVIFAGAYK